MTSATALVIAWAIFLNECDVLYNDKHFISSSLVFLLAVSVLLMRINYVPWCLRRFYYMALALEVAVTIIFFEVAIHYVWEYIEEYLLSHSDEILLTLNRKLGIGACRFLCGGEVNCSDGFANLLLKLISTCFLLGVFYYLANNKC